VATTGDVTNPTTPGTPTAPTVTAASVRIDWAASTDDVGVTGYRIWRGPGPAGAANSLIATVTGTTLTYTDTTVLPSTPYTYKVQAEDAAGNRSAKSTGVDVTTPTGTPPADTTPPSVPAHLAAVVVTG
jgi:chitodextrinase